MSRPTALAAPASAAGDRRATAAGEALVTGVLALAGLATLAAGVWAFAWPTDFAEAVRFAAGEHFVRDAGAFQVGLGAGLLLALLWRDARATVAAGFVLAAGLHAVAHALDHDSGGRAGDPWLLGALSVLVALALAARLRQLGYVVGPVRPATTPALVPFVEQKTVLVTTHRRDGTPVPTPVSLAVDGDRAVMRSYESAGKTRRLRRDPTAEVGPCTSRGAATGPAIPVVVRRLEGDEARRATRLLRRKHPLLHGVVVPLAHRLARSRTGRTVHFELTPRPDGDACPIGHAS